MEDQAKIKKIQKWLGSGAVNIFGLPFAGKDTQGRRLAYALNAPLIGGGEILRGSDMPPRIKELMKTGELIPTDDYVQIVLPFLSQESFKNGPLVLNSVGRWHGEEKSVIKATETAGHPQKAVIFLKMSEDDVWNRWRKNPEEDRGVRLDDDAEVLEIRLREFETKTLPVIEFYANEGLLIEVDGSQDTDSVSLEIINKLTELT